ncbi:MAG: vitamin K epoxide reductase family protein [Patescibacteria group bacterium]
MTALALLFTLSAVGISETVYLIRKRLAAEKPICPIGENCALVLTSRWSKIFIILANGNYTFS